MSAIPAPAAIPIMAVVLSPEISSLVLSPDSIAADGGLALGGVATGLDEGALGTVASETTGEAVTGANVVASVGFSVLTGDFVVGVVTVGGEEGTFEDMEVGLALGDSTGDALGRKEDVGGELGRSGSMAMVGGVVIVG